MREMVQRHQSSFLFCVHVCFRCVYTVAHRCLKPGHFLSVHAHQHNGERRSWNGGPLQADPLLNIYAKPNERHGEKRNIWAVIEEKQRKLRKDETHGVQCIQIKSRSKRKIQGCMWLQKVRHESWVKGKEGQEFFNFLLAFTLAHELKQKLK